MEISPEITIFNFTIYTQGLFLALGFLFSLFVVWSESRKDGFDEEKTFDHYLLTLLISIVVSRIFYGIKARFLLQPFIMHVLTLWKPGLSLKGFALGFIGATYVLSKLFKWSFYRIADIYSLALSFGFAIVSLGMVALQKDFRYLFFFGGLLLFYALFSLIRLKKLFSGSVFILLLFLAIAARTLLGAVSTNDLIFHGILFTIGILLLVVRSKKIMSNQNNLPKTLLNKLKSTLQKKDEDLEKQQKLLDEEDPYLQEGRAEGNSEDVDEAYLEDTRKTQVDAQKNIISSVRSAIKKALSKMDKGSYGTCDSCGEPIDKARLEAFPEAHLCAECARKQEA